MNFLQNELAKEPIKILILASHRTGSSLLGSILKEQNSTAYFYEPLRRVEKSVGFRFEYWLNWPNYKVEKAASTLNQIYSCQYVSLEGWSTIIFRISEVASVFDLFPKHSKTFQNIPIHSNTFNTFQYIPAHSKNSQNQKSEHALKARENLKRPNTLQTQPTLIIQLIFRKSSLVLGEDKSK